MGSSSGVHGFPSNAGSSQSTAGAHASVAQWYAAIDNHVFLPIDGGFAVRYPARAVASLASLPTNGSNSEPTTEVGAR